MKTENIESYLTQLLSNKEFNNLIVFCNSELSKITNLVDKELYLKYRSLGEINLGLKSEFKHTLEKIIKINNSNYFANFNLAKFYYIEKEFNLSLFYSDKSCQIKKTNESFKILSNNLLALNKNKEAEIALIEASNLFKNDHFFLFSLSSLYFRKGKYPLALEYLNKIDKKFHSVELIRYQFALTYLRLGNFIKSEKLFLNILKVNNQSLQCYINIIFIKLAIGDYVQAEQYLKKALLIDNKNVSLIYYELEITGTIGNDKVNFFENNLKNYHLNDQIILSFVFAKYYEKKKDYKSFSRYLNAANKLKRSTYPNYDVLKHIEEQSKLQVFQSNTLLETFKKTVFFEKKNLVLNPIFIIGMPRSGSTLVEQILSSHSHVEGLGETNEFMSVLNEMYGNINYGQLSKKIDEDKSSFLFKKIGRNYLDRIVSIKKTKCKYFIDKMLFNYQFLILIKLSLPNAKFIFCKRNKQENCFSIYKQNFQNSYLPWCYNVSELKKIYDQHISFYDHFNKILKKEILNVNYEDLILNFDSEVLKLLEFLNLDIEKSCFNYHQSSKAVITASNRQVRQKIYKTSLVTNKECKDFFPEIFI